MNYKPNPCVATIGTFDGVHRGHRNLLRQVRSIADERGLTALAVTFDTPPRTVLNGETNRLASLATPTERIALLHQAGMDQVVPLPFTSAMAQLTAREFMQQILLAELNVAVLVVGYDHRFGCGRTEGFAHYVRYGNELGIEVVRGEVCEVGSEPVSSTRIRHNIAQGRVAEAAHLLGYRYAIEGSVVGGYGIGHKIGFPTANIQPSYDRKLLPADGVYAVKVCLGYENEEPTHEPYFKGTGMLNIGHRPTVNNGEERSIEVHILDFEGDLYGRSLRLEFVERLRDEQSFGSIDSLIAQLNADRERVKAMDY